MKVIFGIFFVILFFGGIYYMTMPKDYQISAAKEHQFMMEGSSNLEELRVNAEKTFENFLKKQELSSVDDNDLENLEKAIVDLDKYIRISKTNEKDFLVKLSQMRALLQNIKGKADYEKVQALIVEADNAFASQKSIQAISLYKEALDLQNKINSLYRDSEYYDVRIVGKAEQMLKLVSAAPIAEEIKKLEAQFKEETAQKHWIEAQKIMEKCIELQLKINKEYSNTSFSDFKRVRDFEVELNSLKAAPLQSEIKEAIQAGTDLEKQGKHIEASEKFSYAEEKQKEINTTFSNSYYASDEKLREIISKKETALSQEEYRKLSSQYLELCDMIHKNVSYDQIIKLSNSLLISCEHFQKAYPQSTLLDDEKVLSLRYVSFLGQSINKINEIVAKNVVQLEKGSKVYMYRTEVDQSLYKLVMNENRSRNVGDGLPIETISLENAKDFCRRLSWATAKKVDLPTREQFLIAIGSLKYVDINAISWNASNSQMKTHEVAKREANPKGFYDLLGNVSEFVKDGNGYGTIGGSAQSWTDSISTIPFAPVEKSLRGDRMVGFRFVIWQD